MEIQMERCSAPAGRLRLPWISSFDKTTKGVGAWRGRKKQRGKGRLFRRPCWPAVQVYLAGRAPAGRIIQSNQAITPSIKSRIKGDATLDMTERMKPGTRTGSRLCLLLKKSTVQTKDIKLAIHAWSTKCR
jgi:hypothetical protein